MNFLELKIQKSKKYNQYQLCKSDILGDIENISSYQSQFLQDKISSISHHTDNNWTSRLSNLFHCISSSLCQCNSRKHLMSYKSEMGSLICNCYCIIYRTSSRMLNNQSVIHYMCHRGLCIHRYLKISFSQIHLGKCSHMHYQLQIICSSQFYKPHNLLQKLYKLISTQHHKLHIYT